MCWHVWINITDDWKQGKSAYLQVGAMLAFAARVKTPLRSHVQRMWNVEFQNTGMYFANIGIAVGWAGRQGLPLLSLLKHHISFG